MDVWIVLKRHSHPKITVWPSHVDIRTQYQLQSLDNEFFGLIYAVYHKTDHSYQSQLICFRSVMKDGSLKSE